MMSENNIQPILTFRLADQYYALPIEHVVEVAPMMRVSTLPDAPEAVVGIVNRQGEALLLLDLRLAFNLEAMSYDLMTMFIVVQVNDDMMGLIVDEVFQVKYINSDIIKAVKASDNYITHTITDVDTIYQQISVQALLEDYLVHIHS